ncbi:MAG: HDOD domain-containing protein [Deltaproteobacteria bacterium]|nr:HDOD domain-containing protein [Deltaproteobacteria bacterium]
MEVFVARQPIFNIEKEVIAYELLFRTSLENYYDVRVELDEASAQTISNSFLVIGVESLTKSKKAFINFTQNLLISNIPALLPKEMIVVEILENIEPTDEVIQACRRLKQAGFIIALDDFVFEENLKPLIDLADIIKIDFLLTTGDERKTVMEKAGRPEIKYLAEKVETIEDFQAAVEMGYSYFQGYFFSKPVIIQGKDIPNNKLNMMRVISEVNRPEIGFEKLEMIIKHDVALTYKLLRFINSAFFGLRAKVESIRHALALLGEKEIRRWASLLALSSLAYDKPQELVNISVLRGRFCETLAPQVGLGNREADCFLMGMFSLIDALVDKPKEDILTELPLSEEIMHALLGKPNVFNDVFRLMVAYEKGLWHEIPDIANKLQLPEDAIPEIYFKSVEWTNKTF